MRGGETIILAAIVAGIGVAVWHAREWIPSLNTAASSLLGHPPEPVATKVPESAAKVTVVSNEKVKVRGRTLHTNGPRDPNIITQGNTSVVIVAWSGSFPNPGDLAPGTTRKQLTSRYGPPGLEVASTRNGRLVERYYYSSADHTRLTIATLEDGAVVSSASASR
jgi:hypothetical protein